MTKVTARTRICNAATVFAGLWGAVTGLAQKLGCSRQALYQQAARLEATVSGANAGGPSRVEWQARVAQLEEENRQLWEALEEAVAFPPAKQQQFAATGTAMGLSLAQIGVLLAIMLPARRMPSRAQLGRWTQAWAKRAGAVLAVLDRACWSLVMMLCLDEIFLRRQPVLMGVEPLSMAWVIGHRAEDRTGETWAAAVAPWTALTYTAVDGGSGLRRGLALVRQQRTTTGSTLPLEANLDNFHIQQDGQRALRQEWQEAEHVWERAERADRELAEAGRHGQKLTGPTQRQRRAWAKAAAALAVAERREAAYRRAVAALELFRANGELNDRSWARVELQAALADLPGARWAKFRRMAWDERALTFLDRLHRELVAAEPRAELRQALVTLWRLRHPRRAGQKSAPAAASTRDPALLAVQSVICHKLDPQWQTAYLRVAQVFRQTVRASSVVECMNSVLRMHQARHRGLSQDLINLKRLYWNCRTFAEGKRHGQCPYQHLGLCLPTYEWWQLLQLDPAELAQKLSSAGVAV